MKRVTVELSDEAFAVASMDELAQSKFEYGFQSQGSALMHAMAVFLQACREAKFPDFHLIPEDKLKEMFGETND